MAADSDGDLVETVITCEGNIGDPDFPNKFKVIKDCLKSLVCKGKFSYNLFKKISYLCV